MGYFKKGYGLIERLVSTPTAAGTTALAVNSPTYQQFTGSTTQTVTLPTATGTPISLEFVILNRSTGAVTVNYNSAALAKTVAANTQATFRLVDNSTSDGTWDVTNEGASTSSSATLSSLEKLGALAALGNELYQDAETATLQLKVNPEEVGGDYWLNSNISSLPSARSDVNNFSLNGYFYTVGGWNTNVLSPAPNLRYDLDNNYWLAKANATSPVYDGSGLATTFGYVIGGVTTSDVQFANVQKYTDSTDTWSAATSLPATNATSSGFTIGGAMYNCGGQASGTGVVVYSEAAAAWYTRASMQNNHRVGGGFALNNFGYAAGNNQGGVTALVDKFTDATNSWLTAASMNFARRGNAGSSAVGSGYVFGGLDGSSTRLSSTEQYSDTANLWTTKSSLSAIKGNFASNSNDLSGFLLAVGGNNGSTLSSVERYTPVAFFQIPIFKKTTAVPASIFAAAALNGVATSVPVRLRTDGNTWKYFTANSDSSLKLNETLSAKFRTSGILYATTGYSGGGTNINEAFNEIQNVWTTRQTFPISVYAAGGLALGGLGYILSGFNGTIYTTSIYSYSDITNTFILKSGVLTSGRGLNGSCCSLNGFGYVVGGNDNSAVTAAVDKYNATTDAITSATVLNTAKGYSVSMALSGRLFSFVGVTHAGSALSDSERFDDALNTWVTTAAATAKAYAAGFCMDGFGYVAQGSGSGTSFKYDPSLDSWASSGAAYTAQDSSGGRPGSFGFLFGGFSGSNLATTAKFNDATATYTNVATLNTAREDMPGSDITAGPYYSYELQVGLPTYLAAQGGYQYVAKANTINPISNSASVGNLEGRAAVGGDNNNQGTYYNSQIDAWTLWVALTNPSGGLTGFTLYGELYSASRTSNMFRNNFVLNAWVAAATPISDRFRVCQGNGTTLNGYGYTYGGDQGNSSTMLNYPDQYNSSTNSWASKASSNSAQNSRDVTSSVINGLWLVHNGYGTTFPPSPNVVEFYNDAGNSWTSKNNFPFIALQGAGVTISGAAWSFAGYNGSPISNVLKYYDSVDVWVSQTNYPNANENLAGISNNDGNALLFGGGNNSGLFSPGPTYLFASAIKNIVLGAGLRVS